MVHALRLIKLNRESVAMLKIQMILRKKLREERTPSLLAKEEGRVETTPKSGKEGTE